LECGGHKFTTKGKTIITDGWKAFDDAYKGSLKQGPLAEEDDTALPELTEGQVFPSVVASVRKGKTSPPRRYTEVIYCKGGKWNNPKNTGSQYVCGTDGQTLPNRKGATYKKKQIKSFIMALLYPHFQYHAERKWRLSLC
jgi:hypothetical protein